MQRTLFKTDIREDPRRCRVCGNLTLPPARRITSWLVLVLIGVLVMYIALDVTENGRLDASLYEFVVRQWPVEGSAARGGPARGSSMTFTLCPVPARG